MFKHKRTNSDRATNKAVQEETRELEHLLTMRLTTSVATAEAELENVKREITSAQVEMDEFEARHQAQVDEIYSMMNQLKVFVKLSSQPRALSQDQLQDQPQSQLQGMGWGLGFFGEVQVQSSSKGQKVQTQQARKHQQAPLGLGAPQARELAQLAPTTEYAPLEHHLQQQQQQQLVAPAEITRAAPDMDNAPIAPELHDAHAGSSAIDNVDLGKVTDADAQVGPVPAKLGPILGPIWEAAESESSQGDPAQVAGQTAEPSLPPLPTLLAMPAVSQQKMLEPLKPVAPLVFRVRASAPPAPSDPSQLPARLSFLHALPRTLSAESNEDKHNFKETPKEGNDTSSVYSATLEESSEPLRYSLVKPNRFVFSAARESSLAMTQRAGKMSKINRQTVLFEDAASMLTCPPWLKKDAAENSVSSSPLFDPCTKENYFDDFVHRIDTLKSLNLEPEEFLNGQHLSYFFAKK